MLLQTKFFFCMLHLLYATSCEPQSIFIVFSNLNSTSGLLLGSHSGKVFKWLANFKLHNHFVGEKLHPSLHHPKYTSYQKEKKKEKGENLCKITRESP